MRSNPEVHAENADASADMICRRRLLNSALAVFAAWAAYFAVAQGDWSLLPELGGRLTAAAVTTAAAGFAMWSLVWGDRQAWSRSFQAAAARPHDDDH